MIYVLDASAMIAFLRGEAGAEIVAGILSDSAHQCFAHSVNFCEVYYDFFRAAGEAIAQSAVRDLAAAGILERSDLSPDFWQAAGALKASRRRISLADCFAVTLAQSLDGVLLTCDHHEFDPLAAEGTLQVTFIR